jgi:hypothetical protein
LDSSDARQDERSAGTRRAAGVTLLIPLLDDWASARQLLAELNQVAAAAGQRVGVLLVNDGSREPCPFAAEAAAWTLASAFSACLRMPRSYSPLE